MVPGELRGDASGMSGPVELKVFLAPYKPFHGASKSWDPQREPTWPATTATLITGARDAVLVDGLMTLAEGNALLEWIEQTGKRVTTAYACYAPRCDRQVVSSPCSTSMKRPRSEWSSSRSRR